MRWRCYRCRPLRPGVWPEFESDRALCLKCGASGDVVQALVDIHFVAPDPAGPILGAHGLRYRVACSPRRDGLALHRNDPYTATGDARAVTCPSCRSTPAWLASAAAVPELRHVLIAGDAGCCG